MIALHRAVYSINTRTNFVSPSYMLSAEARSRIGKYSERGFDAVVFEVCLSGGTPTRLTDLCFRYANIGHDAMSSWTMLPLNC